MARRLRRWMWHWLPAVLFMATIFVLSSVPSHRLHIPARISDKAVHGLFYLVLCLLVFRGLRATCNRWLYRYAPLVALLITSGYGIIDEIHQSFTGRNCDIGDWIADTSGAALAAAFLMFYAEIFDEPPDECRE